MGNKGFTLIETIVVIFVLSIIVSMQFIIIDSSYGYQDKMAKEFVNDVRHVQMESMKKPNSNYLISIDIYKGVYYVYNNTIIEKTVTFKKRFAIDYSNVNMKNISFTYEGTPLNAGTFSIKDTKTNKIKEVSIVPTTGRTIVKE